MIVEGTVTNTAAAFAASLGYFNIWIILVLAFLGDAIGDIIMYTIGYYGRRKMLDRYNLFFKVKKSSLKKLESSIPNSLKKSENSLKMRRTDGLREMKYSVFMIKNTIIWNKSQE
jgi:membrane protein YqaA with SNARE-associated domain